MRNFKELEVWQLGMEIVKEQKKLGSFISSVKRRISSTKYLTPSTINSLYE
jgi:hypothetical protein